MDPLKFVLAPERGGVANECLDDAAASPDAERLGQGVGERRVERDSRGHHRRHGNEENARLYGHAFCMDDNAVGAVFDMRNRSGESDRIAERPRQIYGKGMNRLAQEILKFRDFVGDAAIVADQVPQGDVFGRLAPETFDHRQETGLGVRGVRLKRGPCRDAQSGRRWRFGVRFIEAIANGSDAEIEVRPVLRFGLDDAASGDMGADQRLAVMLRQGHDFRHVVADELATEIDLLAEPVAAGFDAAADAVTRLEKQEVCPCLLQHMGGCEAGKAGPDDDDVGSSGRSAQ